MSVVAQYQISASNPSTVGGTSGSLQYFFSNPPQSLWNSGATGVNAPVTNTQLGQVPSSTSGLGMLPFDAAGFKLQAGRFKLVASGFASVTTGTPTLTPIVQIVTPNVTTGSIYTSPVFSTLLGNTASSAMAASDGLAFSIEGDLYFEPNSGTLSGYQTWQIVAKTGGGTAVTQVPVFITAIQGLVVSSPSGTVGNDGSNPGFGFVCGVTFSAGSTGNSASLTEFKIIQD